MSTPPALAYRRRRSLPRPTLSARQLWLAVAAAIVGVATSVSPVAGLALAAGLLFVFATSRDLAAGVVLFTILIFFEQIPGMPQTGLTGVKMGGVVLAGFWILAVLNRQRRTPLLLRTHPFLAYATIFFPAWALASMLWAPNPGEARFYATRLAQAGLLLFIVFSALRKREHIRGVLWAFMAGATLTALVGLGGATSAEQVGPGSQTARLAGGIGDPNELAAFLVPALAIGAALLGTARSPFTRLLAGSMVGINALALFWTQSRGGLVALAATFLVAPFLAGSARQRVLPVILTVAALGVTYYTLVAPPEQLQRVTQFAAGGGSGRQDLWAISIDMYKDHPIKGLGAGNFVVVEPRYAAGNINLERPELVVDTPKGAHNTYLHVMTELGLVGILAFAAVVLGSLAVALAAVRSATRSGERELELLGRGVLVAIVGMLAAFTFISSAHDEQLWLLLGLAAALSSITRAHREAHESTTSEAEVIRLPERRPL